ncbi:superoxide dismutase [Gordonia soli]|uniref:Superoxide dismutase n=1 Tax=Gordonia soli NBRC 108243 TaxID=1223545 RepID=M0QPE3_9ACTN|nr:superoxide dismutase [Gordonia soli]GAC69307.1 superoxide dismutase [Gordonia soli NBRC 108243]
MAEYTLPDLDYDYAALEPHISGRINELHHSKHHATYVKGANTTLEKLAAAREDGTIADKIFGLSANLAFHLGGHTNHSIWWKNLSPDGGDKPEGELAAAIDEFFGSFDKFQAHFTAAATTLQGSGWAILGYDTIGQRLVIEQLYDQHSNTSLGLIPVVVLDVWEHAFYLDYQNVKPDYVKAWWNVVNWADAAERFAKAQSQGSGLIVPA